MIPTLTSHILHPLLLSLRRDQLGDITRMGMRQFTLISQTPYSILFSHFTFLTTFHSESPYPEVRASVSSVDDPLMPVNTFRMWFLGILFTLLTSGFNQIFSMRCKSLSPFQSFLLISCHLHLPRSLHSC
jgi:hypothetical protein